MKLKHGLVVCLWLLAATLVSSERMGRELLKSEKERRDETREDDALEAYFIKQATLNKEQERVLLFASEEAVTITKKVDKAGRKKQVTIFADLWENAKGVTIVKTLALLIDLSPKKRTYYFQVNSDAMDMAEANGYGFKVSEAVYNSLAITDASNDHYHLLDALLYRKKKKEEKSKGSGCQYIEFLFTDAEAWAIDDGRAQQFFRGFDNKDYLPLTECFLKECKAKAAKCCQDKKAVSSGLCGCKVTNKKKKTLQCDHNLFWTAPRVIWLCSTQDCDPDEKCICPDLKTKKSKKESKSDSGKGKKTLSKDKDEEETKKAKSKSKKSEVEEETKKGKSKKSEVEEETKKGKSKSKKSEKVEEETKGKRSKSKSEKPEKESKKSTSEKETKSKKTESKKSEKETKKVSKDASDKDSKKTSSKSKSESKDTKSKTTTVTKTSSKSSKDGKGAKASAKASIKTKSKSTDSKKSKDGKYDRT